MLRRCCFHVLYHLNHSPVGHLLLDLLQLCLCVGGRQQDVKTAVSCEGKPRHLLAKKDKKNTGSVNKWQKRSLWDHLFLPLAFKINLRCKKMFLIIVIRMIVSVPVTVWLALTLFKSSGCPWDGNILCELFCKEWKKKMHQWCSKFSNCWLSNSSEQNHGALRPPTCLST